MEAYEADDLYDLSGPGASAAMMPSRRGDTLADVLERVLDKGIVVAGDIQVNVLSIELLTIKLRLLIASVDRAKEMGIDWWEADPMLSSAARERGEDRRDLHERIRRLEEAVGDRRLGAGRRDARGQDDRGEDAESSAASRHRAAEGGEA